MKITIASIFAGLVIGYIIPLKIPESIAFYVTIVIIIGLESILGGIYSKMQGNFEIKAYFAEFFGNVLLASLIVFIGQTIKLNLISAVVVVFGIKIFNIFSEIRKILLQN